MLVTSIFLFFPQCFQKALFLRSLKVRILWLRVNVFSNSICDIAVASAPIHAFLELINYNPFPNKPLILRVCSESLLKTLWEKEKLLVKSNFSFSYGIFYLLENSLPFSLNLKLLSANSFWLEESKICRLGKG